jgi:hypothetical protein
LVAWRAMRASTWKRDHDFRSAIGTEPGLWGAERLQRRIRGVMKIDGHYDPQADIAWLRFEGYDPSTVVSEDTDFGLREIAAETLYAAALKGATPLN